MRSTGHIRNVHIAPENPPAQNSLIGVSSPGKSLVIPALPKPDITENTFI